MDSEPQTVSSANKNQVVIKVDKIKSSGLLKNKIDLYFSSGIPDGYNSLINGATFTPKLMELSSNEVSAAGSMIIATVPGVSVDDEITLINNADKKDICESAKMTASGQLEC